MPEHKMVDFHMHSNLSDGIYKPEKLISIAAGAGLAAVGLTDHDTMDGFSAAVIAAEKYNLEIIPGLEISAMLSGEEIHILGYYPDSSQALSNLLIMLRNDRFIRMEKMVDRLVSLGFRLKAEDIYQEAGEAAPGRLHLARVMLKKKYVHTINEAFSCYLEKGRPAYVQRELVELEDVVTILGEAKAVPVIAHPGKSKIRSLQNLFRLGIRGVEVFHPEHSVAEVKYLQQLVLENNLLVTGGSDFHGPQSRKSRYLQKMAVPYFHLERMKKFADNIC